MNDLSTRPSEAIERAAQSGPLFIVLNAGSGHNEASEVRDTLSRIFAEAGREHEFLMIEDASTLARTAALAVGKALSRRGVVVAAGGDGTINCVAQAVLGSGCPFGVLPQGTFNYFGRAHGIPQDTEAGARALLGAHLRPAQAGLVNDRVFLVNASLGLYPQLLEDREAFKQQFGRSRLVAMISGLRTLLRERRQLRLSIELEGETRTLRTPTLFVGNNPLQLERLGFAEAAALQRGLLAAIAVRPIGVWPMLGLALRGALGSLGEAEQVSSVAFHKLTVWPHGQYRIKVGTDGEIHQMRTPLVFRVAPQPLMLLVPAPEDRVEVA
ncbi:MAG: diacylglycerol/lipid kinase family protein [Panacagrimonas sp.]